MEQSLNSFFQHSQPALVAEATSAEYATPTLHYSTTPGPRPSRNFHLPKIAF
jgi:hypothetical protein